MKSTTTRRDRRCEGPASPAALLMAALALSTVGSCNRDADSAEPAESHRSSTTPSNHQLPPLRLTDDSEQLLLTWIDEQGDFHVVQRIEDVPEAARQQVRVVVTTETAGTGQLVYVADLTQRRDDGSYSVTTMSRSAWNELGADRRKVRLEALAPQADVAARADSSTQSGKLDPELAAKVKVIIYGADWCKPCHEAEAFLQKLGVDVTKKDVERSRAAQAEMEQKLSKAGRMGASIPVLDVAGQLIVGFNESVLEQAVRAAAKPEAL